MPNSFESVKAQNVGNKYFPAKAGANGTIVISRHGGGKVSASDQQKVQGLVSSTVTQEYRCGATYSNGDFTGQYGPVAADGSWSVSTNPPCTLAGGTVVSLQVVALDLEGSTVEREFPPPSGC